MERSEHHHHQDYHHNNQEGFTMVYVDPWRKHKTIETIAAFDIVIATFSIFHNGKAILTVFGGLHNIGQKESLIFIFLIFFFTFGIQILQILFAMYLLKGSKKDSSTMSQAIRITRVWIGFSAIFLFLLILELIIGITSFDRNDYTTLFIVFTLIKFVWRIFTIYFVICFKRDLEGGLVLEEEAAGAFYHSQSETRNPSLIPVFKMIVTNPENCDVDITNNDALEDRSTISRLPSSSA